MKLKKEKSCGCIIINDNKVLLICSINWSFWWFPKWHVEKWENEIETALRETKEEVWLDVEIDDTKRYVLNYTVRNEIDKTTVLYLAKPKNKNYILQESEISNAKWCDFEEALEILTFDNWKNILKKVIEDLK